MKFLQTEDHPNNNAINVDARTLVFFHTSICKENLKRQTLIDFPNALIAKTNSIPGLYIYNDFVTTEEEYYIVKGLDEAEGEHKW